MVMRRIVWRMLGPLMAALLLFVVPLAVLHERDVRAQVVELVERRAASIGLVAGIPVDPTEWDALALPALPGVDGEQVALVDTTGRLLAGAQLPDAVLAGSTVARARAGEISGGIDRDADLVVGAAPVVVDGVVEATAVVIVPGAEVAARTRTALLVLTAAAAALVAAAAFAGRALARSIVRPIEELDDVAARLAAGELDARTSVETGPLELRRLGQRLNDSADQLRRMLHLQRSFVADASHQLRSPLAALRLQLENAEIAAPDDARHVGAAIREVDRLTAIVDDLLALARAEGRPDDPIRVDVAEVVRDRVQAAATSAAENGVRIEMSGTDDAAAWCVPGGLEQILDNLLDNAVRASPAGATVEVTIETRDEDVSVRVCDRGPGLTEQQRVRAFERFWQASAGSGSGLGLPIAAAIAQASNGSVELAARPGGGLVAEVRLQRVPLST